MNNSSPKFKDIPKYLSVVFVINWETPVSPPE